ncbi:hypothetical protein HY504_03330 [Candidatus Wolfebacteria bacterium]|nr:hypothetical protein [Candidatus Wolfebacteria bacterium]
MKEYFAVLTSRAAEIICETFVVDPQRKIISCLGEFSVSKDDGLRALRGRMAFLFYPRRYSVLIGAGSKEAMTMYGEVPMLRDNPKVALEDGELDNCVSKAVWQAFEEGKARAIRQLSVGDIDLLLRDVRITSVLVDGKPWVSGEGKGGRKVIVSFLLTFILRPFERDCVNALPRRAAMHFAAETMSAAAHFLSREAGEGNFLFAAPFEDRTDLVLAMNKHIAHYDSFAWGWGYCVRVLAQSYKLSSSVAQGILARLGAMNASPRVLRRLARDVEGELQTLLRGLDHAADRARVRSILLYAPRLCGFQKFSKMVACIDKNTLFAGLDIVERDVTRAPRSLEITRPGEKKISFFGLALYAEYQSIPAHPLMNRFARRRMRWLLAG